MAHETTLRPRPLAALTRQEAHRLAGVAADFETTQLAGGIKGVHGTIPQSIFTIKDR